MNVLMNFWLIFVVIVNFVVFEVEEGVFFNFCEYIFVNLFYWVFVEGYVCEIFVCCNVMDVSFCFIYMSFMNWYLIYLLQNVFKNVGEMISKYQIFFNCICQVVIIGELVEIIIGVIVFVDM